MPGRKRRHHAQRDTGRRAILEKRLGKSPAVHARHGEVRENDSRSTLIGKHPKGLQAVGRDPDPKTILLENLGQGTTNVVVVVHQKHRRLNAGGQGRQGGLGVNVTIVRESGPSISAPTADIIGRLRPRLARRELLASLENSVPLPSRPT